MLRAPGSPPGLSQRRAQRSEAELTARAGSFPEIARLATIPGIGHIWGAVIGSEIGDRQRFDSADARVNYSGLVPSSYASGGVSIHGAITRQRPVWLRWALVTAANAVTRGKSPLGRRCGCCDDTNTPMSPQAAGAASIARCA